VGVLLYSEGAPKIRGELQKLGFELSERTVARYLQRIRRHGNSGQRWLTFLKNHREVIVAFDFFTVPTLTFQLLYCFFVIEHGRRRILHFNVTRHPTADWVVQQLREAFPDAAPYRYAILDHDSKFDADVMAFLKATVLKPKRTSVQRISLFVLARVGKERPSERNQSQTLRADPSSVNFENTVRMLLTTDPERWHALGGSPAPTLRRQHYSSRNHVSSAWTW
jgi:hypothetical protein